MLASPKAAELMCAVAEERERCATLAEHRGRELTGLEPVIVGSVIAEAIREGKPAAPQWTREVPTVPGWYWWRNAITKGGKSVVDLVAFAGDLYMVDPEGREGAVSASAANHGEWQGPLEVPQ